MCYYLDIKTPYQKYYSKSYKENATVSINEKWVQTVKSKLAISFSSKNKILDIACGISTLGKNFGNEVYGIDLNAQAVKVAKRHGIHAIVGNIEDTWKYPDNYFNIVIASHIIEHVVNPDKLLLEAKRVLKKGGLLIIATPNLAAWFNRILLLLGFQPFFTEVSTMDKTLGITFTRKLTPMRSPLGHLRVFTLGSLKDIVKLHEFKIIQIAGAEFLAFPPLLLFFDKIFSYFPSFASNIIVIAKKN